MLATMSDHEQPKDYEAPILLEGLDNSHPGLSNATARAFCASACVCLKRHHAPPKKISIETNNGSSQHLLVWTEPSQRDLNSNRNRQDATRDGAYAMALACIERILDLVTVGRAEELTGADWYVAPPGCGVMENGGPDLDDPTVIRLEVGGHDDRPSLAYELKEKIRQLGAGESEKPGVAAVVGFKVCRILIQTHVQPGRPATEK